MAEDEDDYKNSEAKPRSSNSNQIMSDIYYGEVEKSFQVSPYFADSFKKPHNPDPLVEKDYTYGVYESMLADDQVDVALKLKKDLIVGSGWYIETPDESLFDIKEELETSLDYDSIRPLSEILEDLTQSYEYGFSISEKIFQTKLNGQIALKDIKPRHPASWLIHTDDHGNVSKYEQRGPHGNVDVNPASIIHYVNNQKFQNPYGRSDLYPAYQAWISKRHITRFYAIYLESAAGPKPVARYDRRAPPAVVDEIFNILKKFQTKTSIAIPKEFELEFLESKSNAGDAYIKGINLFNMFIGRALFIPDLLGFQGSDTAGGSFSLGKEQIGLFYKHIYRRRAILERIMDQHVIMPLCLLNYGVMDKYPKFKFNPLSDEDAIKQSELWIKGVQGAGWTPSVEEINHFRKMVKFPQSDEVEFASKYPAPFGGGGFEDKAEDKTEDPEKKEFSLDISSIPGDYKNKVNFKLADQTLKNTVSKIITESKPIVEMIFDDLYFQLRNKKIIQTQDLEKSDSIKLKYLSKLQSVFKKHFRNLYLDAQAAAKLEVRKSDFAANIPADEFLNFLDQETYKYIGDWSYEITKKTKNQLIAAIKDGKPLSSVIDVLDDEGKKLSDVSLERYSRTKTTEVFNKGRMEYFESTGVVAAYQYSAILDSVTSEICSELDGKIFEKDEAPIPPLHFNCRSVLIPITRFESYKVDKTTNDGRNIDKFIEKSVEDKGFSRFSNKEKPNVSFEQIVVSDCIDVFIYSQNGKKFKKTTVEYLDERKDRIKKINHEEIKDETSV